MIVKLDGSRWSDLRYLETYEHFRISRRCFQNECSSWELSRPENYEGLCQRETAEVDGSPSSRKEAHGFSRGRNCDTHIYWIRISSEKPHSLHGLSLGLPEGFGGDTEGCTAYASARMAKATPSCGKTGRGCSPTSTGLLCSVPEKGCHANKSGSTSQCALAIGSWLNKAPLSWMTIRPGNIIVSSF